MAVKLYNIFILIVDIVLLSIKWILYTVEKMYRTVISPEPADVSDDIVLITGTAHGIGKEIALQYGRLKATVICVDINDVGNVETVNEIRENNGKAYSYVCDVTDRAAVFKLADKIKADVGIVTILVNNAGIMPTRPLLQQNEAEIRKTFEINVYAHFWLIQAFLSDMLKQNKGHIVALSSVAGVFGLKNLVPYCGTKYAVKGYMEALQDELRNDSRSLNIKLTSVYPYMVNTGLCKRPHTRFPNLMRLLEPIEVAEAVVMAQRQGLDNVSVPKPVLYMDHFCRNFPYKCCQLLGEFLDTGVQPDTE